MSDARQVAMDEATLAHARGIESELARVRAEQARWQAEERALLMARELACTRAAMAVAEPGERLVSVDLASGTLMLQMPDA